MWTTTEARAAVDDESGHQRGWGTVCGMARAPAPLPRGLDAGFTVAQGRSQGVTRARTRSGDLVAPTSGVRIPGELMVADSMVEAFRARCRAFALVLPEPWAYSHLTAARLLGLPVAQFWSPEEPLHVVRPTWLSAVRRRGTVHHRGLEHRGVVTRHGLPLTGPADTWCDVAAGLSLEERVVLGDATVNEESSGIPLADLTEAVTRRARETGVRALREALPLVRTHSLSRRESLVRLAMHRRGLPEPELNVDVLDGLGGWLARPDFVWRRQRVIAEYDGEQHRQDLRQWRRDHVIRADLVAEGWRVHTFIDADLSRPAALDRRIEAIAHDLGVTPT